MHRLPARIAAVMIGTVLVFVATVTLAVLWMAHALDEQARRDSTRLVDSALSNLLSGMDAVNLEYAKWDALVQAAEVQDMDWLSHNIGVATASSLKTDLAVLWGGSFDRDIGWLDQSPVVGMSRLVSARTLELAERSLADVPLGATYGTAFFIWRSNDLFAAAAARIEWPYDSSHVETDDSRIARLLMAQRVTREQIAVIADATLLDGLRVDRRPPPGRPVAALPGPDGAPIAWLSWEPPHPGATMLRRMILPLTMVLALTAGLAALGIVLLRRNARHLVTAEQHASVAARTDALTGLPNRAAFNEALSSPARAGERAILFLDVNGFKGINDSIGHAAGDQVIAELARRLARLGGEGWMLARIGGDEFVILLTGADACTEVEWVARAVELAMVPPFEVMGHELRLQAAMGYAVQATDLMAGDDLLRQADLAMYEAKRLKDQGPVAFGALIEQAVQDARAIERALRAALEKEGEFSIAYQPIAAPGGGLSRVEALARWTSPELGVIPPDRFIAVAEQSGLIIRLGQILLRLVCDDLAAHPELRVSINVSPLQLMAPTFVPDLLATLAGRGIDPARVEVELTESVVVDDPRLAAQRLGELHEAGFSTALDDFGTGYSSIGYLQQMGFNTLKVDRSFVSGFCGSPDRLALVSAMILLAHALGLRVTCEGVETEEELAMLCDLGCDLAQGYHLDRPLPIAALAARWLGQGEGRAAVA